jgi:hypothetical protein
MTRRFWTEQEVELLREIYPNLKGEVVAERLGISLKRVYNKAKQLELRKSQAFFASPASCRTNGKQGIGTRFETGHVPANKGLRRPGWAPGRMAETQFRKGERKGVAVDLYKPIGTERVSKDGYLERKVNDGMPLQKRWRAVHLLVWEEANGALPKGFAVCFKNRDRKDTRLENLELVSRADLARRNSMHNLPPELKKTIRALGSLKRRIKREEQDRRSA